jgi:phage recombination protein Bet
MSMSSAMVPAGLDPTAIDGSVAVYRRIEAVRNVLAPDLNDAELQLYAMVAHRMELDPFARQIYAVKRGGRLTFQVGIDGFRSSAEQTGEYDGQDEPEYGPWLDKPFPHPEWARVTVHRFREGRRISQSATARWDSYYPGDQLGAMWKRLPEVMLAKCAEALAFRKLFPKRFAGLYVAEEMAHQDAAAEPVRIAPTAKERLAQRKAQVVAKAPPAAPAPPPPPDDGSDGVVPDTIPVVVDIRDHETVDPITAGELRTWLRDHLIGISEALLAARGRWGQETTLDSLTDVQRGELRAMLDRPDAA